MRSVWQSLLKLKDLHLGLIIMLPFLVGGIIWVAVAAENPFYGDEGRYFEYAQNLSKGHFSPEGEVFLVNGPGYPLFLIPFAMVDAPLIWWKMLNPFLFWGAAIFVFLSLRFYSKKSVAIPVALFTVLVLFYINSWVMRLYSESLTLFLICGFIYFSIRAFHRPKNQFWIDIGIGGVFLGLLALTKVIFGYVLPVMILAGIIGYPFFRKKVFLAGVVSAFAALLVCLPYLSYTYNLTGRLYYWSTWGGSNLYWMSSPYDGEYGAWINYQKDLPPHHKPFFDSIASLPHIDQNDAKIRKSVEHIKTYPVRYARNIIANLERMFFNFPYAYRPQKVSFMFVPGMILMVLLVLSLIPALPNWRRIPPEIYGLLFFAAVYVGGSSLVSSYPRMLMPVYPIFALYLCYVGVNFIRIEETGSKPDLTENSKPLPQA